jgi:uncharacterized membrane protein (UPF0127 family)
MTPGTADRVIRARTLLASLLLTGFASTLSCASGAKPAVAATPAAKSAPHVVITTASGSRSAVKVEIAASPEARERGLMFRRTLGADEGMVFLFDEESVHNFWMKNTLIPLDMIFIAGDGTIAGIVAEAAPETLTPRTVGKPSQYVLEVNGGWAALKGVQSGDRVDLSEPLAIHADLPPLTHE